MSPYLRDRSAPSALVGFGIGMAGVENRRLGLALVVLGAGWWLAAIRAAHSAESSLPDRALRVANLVRRAAPGGWRQPRSVPPRRTVYVRLLRATSRSFRSRAVFHGYGWCGSAATAEHCTAKSSPS